MDAEQTQVNLVVVRAFEMLRVSYFLNQFFLGPKRLAAV
jgi:hypothetical protein